MVVVHTRQLVQGKSYKIRTMKIEDSMGFACELKLFNGV